MGGQTIPRGKMIKTGSQAVSLGTVSYPIAIAGGMGGASYTVWFNGGLVVGITATALLDASFNLILSIGLFGTVNWAAIED